ncbi:hypothetical protein SCUCBS95973_003021 [Sporothrix curviconia]|uniref:Cupin type-1 domain-containing protein n=1 Tax=Sporothrix curviconia TaxID=1260050 RepID=A0ABP0BBW9_9PEZI
MNPPLHYHIDQTESFRILLGECHLFNTTADVPWKTLSAKDPDGLKTASIPNTIYHTLQNASTSEHLILDVKLSPEDAEGEQMFFRNFFGYLDDCRIAGQPPSFFQLMVFLKAADTPLGLPMPTQWLRVVVSRVFMNVMGWWGEWVLGYEKTYEEYYTERKDI